MIQNPHQVGVISELLETNNVTGYFLEECLELASVHIQTNVEGGDDELVLDNLVKAYTVIALLLLLEATVLMGCTPPILRGGVGKSAAA